MIRYEINKLLQQMPTRIILFVLFVINVFLVWNQQLPGTTQHYNMDASDILSLYEAMPEDATQALKALEQQNHILVDAIVLEKDVGKLLTSDIYTEQKLFSNMIERVEPIAHYNSILNEIEENAETLILSGIYKEDSFGYRNILKSQERYQLLDDGHPQILYTGAIELLPGGRVTDLILLVFCILVGFELISAERINGTISIIKPTYRGGFPLIITKILSGLFMVFFATCILYGTNLVIGFIRCGVVSMNAPIQSVFGFIRSPWKINIAMYVLFFFCMKFLWASSVTALVYLSCVLSASILGCCGFFLLIGSISFITYGSELSLFSTSDTVRMFSEYRNLNFFGFPVSSFIVSILVMIVVFFVGYGITTIIYTHFSLTIFERKSKKNMAIGRISTNLLVYEARKLFLLNGSIWVLIGLMAVQLFTYLNFEAYISPQERMYVQYSEILSGTADNKKDDFLAKETERFDGLHEQMEEYFLAFSNGQIKQEAYEVLCSSIQRQLEGEEAFLKAKEQYDQMKMQGNDYVCQIGYERMFGTEGQEDAFFLAIKLIIALSLGLASINSIESESNMILLINSVPRKQDCFRIKVILASIYAVIAVMITYVPYILAIIKRYGLPGMLSSGSSVPLLRLETQTVMGGLSIYTTITMVVAIFCAHVVSIISKKTGNVARTIIVSTVLMLISLCILLGLKVLD